jgi:hypothetical protein
VEQALLAVGGEALKAEVDLDGNSAWDIACQVITTSTTHIPHMIMMIKSCRA